LIEERRRSCGDQGGLTMKLVSSVVTPQNVRMQRAMVRPRTLAERIFYRLDAGLHFARELFPADKNICKSETQIGVKLPRA
jgi:hypothetical protein